MARVLVLTLTALVVIFGSALVAEAQAKKFVCYWGTWSWWRPGNGKYGVNDVDANLCTHLVYGFAGLDSNTNTIKALDPYLDFHENWGLGFMKKFNEKKQVNTNLKTILAIGGWNEGSESYSKMASDPAKRQTFINSVIDMLKERGFDGLDMDWEYPASRGGEPHDKENFITLLRELKTAFIPHGFILTAAVSCGRPTVDPGYNIPAMAEYLDVISIMTYDIHGAWDSYTHHNAPLYKHQSDVGNTTWFNVEYGTMLWVNQVKAVNPAWVNKIVLGLPLYGRGFTIGQNPPSTGIYTPSTGECQAGPYSKQAGWLNYNEICEMQRDPTVSWTRVWDSDIQAPYLLYTTSNTWMGTQWLGYDDIESLGKKLDFAAAAGLGGAMVWSIDADDFNNRCGGGKNPLMTYISNRVLNGQQNTPPPTTSSTTTSSTTTTTTTTTTQSPNEPTTSKSTTTSTTTKAPGECVPYQGAGPCSPVYYQCNHGITRTLNCGSACLVWNSAITACDWKYNVPACGVSDCGTVKSGFDHYATAVCQELGANENPDDCHSFYYCKMSTDQMVATLFHCNEGLAYDATLHKCVPASKVAACNKGS